MKLSRANVEERAHPFLGGKVFVAKLADFLRNFAPNIFAFEPAINLAQKRRAGVWIGDRRRESLGGGSFVEFDQERLHPLIVVTQDKTVEGGGNALFQIISRKLVELTRHRRAKFLVADPRDEEPVMLGRGDHEFQILAFEGVWQESRLVPKARVEGGKKGTKLLVRFSVATRQRVNPKFARIRRRDLGLSVVLASSFVPRVAFLRFGGVGARFGAFLRKLALKFARIDAKTRRKALQRAEDP